MRFPCPHCQVMIDVVEPPPDSDVQCPQCGSRISSEMVQTTIEPPSEEQAIADREAGLQPAQSSSGSPAGHVENIPHEAQPKELFGRFQLLERLGGGSFGEVYRAYDPSLDRVVALKRPHRRAPPRNEQEAKRLAEEARRFLIEAQSAAQLKHPHIVGVYEVGEIEGRPYFTAEYIRGIDLAELIKREKDEGRLIPVRQVAQLCGQVAEALHAAHEVKIVHRDLKPANIIVGEDGLPRVMDFGMAKRESAAEFVVTQAGAVLGSPAYMSPEQWQDSSTVDRGTDIWSLGVMLFELLTGDFPFRASRDFVRLKEQILNDDPPAPSKLNSQVPADLDTLCLKCLAKDSTRRFPTAATLAEELRRFLDGEPILSRPMGTVERTWRWCRRKPMAAFAASMGYFAFILVWSWLMPKREPWEIICLGVAYPFVFQMMNRFNKVAEEKVGTKSISDILVVVAGGCIVIAFWSAFLWFLVSLLGPVLGFFKTTPSLESFVTCGAGIGLLLGLGAALGDRTTQNSTGDE